MDGCGLGGSAVFGFAFAGSAGGAGVDVCAVVAPGAGALPASHEGDGDADGAEEAGAAAVGVVVEVVAVREPAAFGPGNEGVGGDAAVEFGGDGIAYGLRDRVGELVAEGSGQEPDDAADGLDGDRVLYLVRALLFERGGAAGGEPLTTCGGPAAVGTTVLYWFNYRFTTGSGGTECVTYGL